MSTSELALIAIELEVEHRRLREDVLDGDTLALITLANRVDVLFDLVRRLTVEVGKYQLERQKR